MSKKRGQEFDSRKYNIYLRRKKDLELLTLCKQIQNHIICNTAEPGTSKHEELLKKNTLISEELVRRKNLDKTFIKERLKDPKVRQSMIELVKVQRTLENHSIDLNDDELGIMGDIYMAPLVESAFALSLYYKFPPISSHEADDQEFDDQEQDQQPDQQPVDQKLNA